MHLVLDISLTVAKPWLQAPSGIDRVETAHARHWRRLPERDITFVMRTAWDDLAALPDGLARDILADAEARIAPGIEHKRLSLMLRPALAMTMHFHRLGLARLRRRLAARPDSVLLTVSNATLHKHRAIAALKARGCRFLPLVHDVIPLTHPHCFPPGESERHARRMEGVARFGDAALAVSEATREAMAGWFGAQGWRLPPVTVAPLGLDLPMPAGPPSPDPYFVMIGSLEPRKNHHLMLQLWSGFAGQPDAPRLIVIGRRPLAPHPGTILLDSGDFQGRVEDRGRLPDAEAARLLRGARALLFPSLTEGYGLPLAEALAMGVPVLASDIPAFREVGGAAPEFLHPLDGPGWREMILDYAAPASARRRAQEQRIATWETPRWDRHFSLVEPLLLSLAATRHIAGRDEAMPLTPA
jgi:glycosyltransferase involved in cell wall biosynthesis